MTTMPAKFYVVWKGHKTGIFDNWEDCSAQVTGYPDAEYKAFPSREAAEEAFRRKYDDYRGKLILPSYSVDASCIGNPGPMEYRCVDNQTSQEVFRQGPYEQGTSNIGEFLGIADTLMLCKDKNLNLPIYSDSANAIGWIKDKRCKTRLARDERNAELFELIERAETWLRNNDYANEILKWETEAWGEIPADFGRK
jgi:ribonuclease HI